MYLVICQVNLLQNKVAGPKFNKKIKADLRPLNHHENFAGFGGTYIRICEIVLNDNFTYLFGNVVHLTAIAATQGVTAVGVVVDFNVGGIGMLDSDCHSGYPLSFLYLYYIPDREKSQVKYQLKNMAGPKFNIYLKKISGCPLIYGYVRDAIGFFVVDEAIAVLALNPDADVEAVVKCVRDCFFDGDTVTFGSFVNLACGCVDDCAKLFNGHHVQGDGGGISGDGIESLIHGVYLSFI